MKTALLALALLTPAAASAFDHDHSAWQAVLDDHLRDGLVDYERLRADPSPLDAYLGQLATVGEGDYTAWSPEQRLTFWLNAYNAFLVRAVVDHYPLKRAWWRSRGYRFPPNSLKQIDDFDRHAFTAVKEELSLREVRGLIGKLSDDPRLAFALSCGCQGGPPLPAQAFRAAQLEEQLESAALTFSRDPRRVSLDARALTLTLSPVFRGARIGAPIPLLSRYLPADQAEALKEPGWTIAWQPEDWELDELGSREVGRSGRVVLSPPASGY
jgi:hypothetical protein